MLTHMENHSLSSLVIKNGLHLLKLLMELGGACVPILYSKERTSSKDGLMKIYKSKACKLILVRMGGLQT